MANPDRPANVVPFPRIGRPACSQCKAAMTLERIEPHTKGPAVVEVFRCDGCGLVEKLIIAPD
jgi:hypothetical protein